jgi:hypothetical protein
VAVSLLESFMPQRGMKDSNKEKQQNNSGDAIAQTSFP